jgi:hypothetical protein
LNEVPSQTPARVRGHRNEYGYVSRLELNRAGPSLGSTSSP